MNTALDIGGGRRLKTVEHLAAAFAASGIDNATVDVDGPELPIFDGSARRWCDVLDEAGRAEQDEPRRALRIRRPVQVTHNGRMIRAEPGHDLTLDVTAPHSFTGVLETWRGSITSERFRADLAGSRSSGQISRLWTSDPARRSVHVRRWLALLDLHREVPIAGGSNGGNAPRPDLPNAATSEMLADARSDSAEPVLRGARLGRAAVMLGPWTLGGARFPDEIVRHHALDLLGDLRLADGPILGRVVAHRPTHALAYVFARALAASPDCWEWVTD